MAQFNVSLTPVFPTIPVLDPINRAKLIAQVGGQLLAAFIVATAALSEQTIIDPDTFAMAAADLVYKAEELALPPKVPSSS